jgi:hypothetical protein
MRDGYLARKLSEQYGFEWVIDVYKAGSGYVHFSNYVTKSSTRIESETERTTISTIGKHDEFISDEEKFGAAVRMNQISIYIAVLITQWKERKERYKKTEPNKGA